MYLDKNSTNVRNERYFIEVLSKIGRRAKERRYQEISTSMLRESSAMHNLRRYIKNNFDENIDFIIENLDKMDACIISRLNNRLVIFYKLKGALEKVQLKEDECCICLETLKMAILKCNHPVCFNCEEKINTCPLCRTSIK